MTLALQNIQAIPAAKEKRPGAKPTATSIALGTALGAVTVAGGSVVGSDAASSFFSNKMIKISDKLSGEEVLRVKNILSEGLEKTGLVKKGVEIRYNYSVPSYGTEKVGDVVKKVIKMPKDKMVLSGFHEMGHAMNDHFSKVGKFLQKTRSSFKGHSALLVAIPIALIALIKPEAKDKPESALDKTTTFIKKNAGILTFAAFLPEIIEEGMATIKGNGYPKKVLSADLFKKVRNTNALGLASYVATAAICGLAVTLGVKLKDKIANNDIKQKNK